MGCVSWCKKHQLLTSEILTTFVTFRNNLIAIPKTVYLIECNQCWKQYTGSPKTTFYYRANNYKSAHRKFKNKKQVPKEALKQKLLHKHFCSNDHNGIQGNLGLFGWTSWRWKNS